MTKPRDIRVSFTVCRVRRNLAQQAERVVAFCNHWGTEEQ